MSSPTQVDLPTPPVLKGPSDKEKKYDRQLRLWAAAGQAALENAHLLLVNSGSGTVGVETLKNLVLPGVGKFTIADDALVNEADLGVNFFLDDESVGMPRSQRCVDLLLELNPDVQGDWFPKEKDDTYEQLLKQSFTLIIYSLPIEPHRLELLQRYSQQHRVPLVSIHSAGFYSYFKTHLPGTFPIVDTHPDTTATTDLRLLTPWPELSAFVADITKNIDEMSAMEHGHIPYLALTLYYLAKWKETHDTYPSSYAHKKEFGTFLADGARTNNPEGGEENYDEAVAAVMKTVTTPSLSSEFKEVLAYQPNEIESRSSFWIIADAIKQFLEKHGELPLPGSVPDMKAQSTVYVQLQGIYKAKARRDAAEVLETVQAHSSGADIPATEVEAFCKNAAFIKLINSTSDVVDVQELAQQEFKSDEDAEEFNLAFSLLPIYLSLSATSHVQSAISTEILATLDKTIPGASTNERLIKISQEVARAKGGELHNISALTGGMISQEIIKIITKQYVPIDNTCVFDGITSKTQIFRT